MSSKFGLSKNERENVRNLVSSRDEEKFDESILKFTSCLNILVNRIELCMHACAIIGGLAWIKLQRYPYIKESLHLGKICIFWFCICSWVVGFS
jgi:hypothetical protein